MRISYASDQHHNNNNNQDNYQYYTNAKSKTALKLSASASKEKTPLSSSMSVTSGRPLRHGLCPWSMPIKLFAFLFFIISISCDYADSAAASAAGQGAAGSSMAVKGLKSSTRMRSPKIAHIHVLQAVPESLPKNEHNEAANKTHQSPLTSGKFEIRSVSGEPNYKSVNLTWEVEFVPSPQDIITNTSDEIEPPKAFQLYFCELQSFGPHRCRSKIVNDTITQYDNSNNDLDVIEQIRRVRQYAAQVDNLRMATKYSFHIRSVPKRKHLKITGRSEGFENEIDGAEDFLSNNNLGGQTIVIPTKGFSAQATQCLPNASEIEVETGPNFGGKIVVDGGSCGIKGNPNDTKDKYTMRIDHKACGSMVKPETNTVETFITVQENLGIFTHSTRRFVVVCSYQSGLQTVRASFSVPGRGGAAAVQPQDSGEEDDRMGRGLRPFRYVDKSELILKEEDEDNAAEHIPHTSSEETEALVQEMDNPILNFNQNQNKTTTSGSNLNNNNISGDDDDGDDDLDTANAVALLENIIPGVNEDDIKAKDHQIKLNGRKSAEAKEDEEMQHENARDGNGVGVSDNDSNERFSANFAKLILERNDRNQYGNDDDDDVDVGEDHYIGGGDVDDGMALIADSTPTGRGFGSALELISTNMGSVLLTVLLSVILIAVFVFILYRETQRPRLREIQPHTPTLVATLPRHQHLKETHTIPRTLRTKHQDIMA